MIQLAFIAATLASPIHTGDPLGGAIHTYIAPNRLFAVEIPRNWQVVHGKNPNEVQFVPPGPGGPLMFVRRLTVPAGASPRHLALRAIESRLAKLPRYKPITQHDGKIGTYATTTVTAAYSHQGNVQYPRVVEEVFLIIGNDGFIFHFDVAQPNAKPFAKVLGRFYNSFVPYPPAPQPGTKTMDPLLDQIINDGDF